MFWHPLLHSSLSEQTTKRIVSLAAHSLSQPHYSFIMAMNETPTCHKRNNSGKHQWTALQLVGRWKRETRGIGVMRERVNGGVRIVRMHWNRMGFGELWWRLIDGPVSEDTSRFVEMDRWCSNGAWEEVICWWVDHVGCEWWMNGRWTQCLSGLGLEWEEWDDHGRF